MVFAVAGLSFLEVLIILTGGRGWHLVPLMVPLSLAVLGLLYYRPRRVLEVDSWGISLLRGTKVVRAIPWAHVKEVRHGKKLVTTWVFLPGSGYVLLIRGRRSRISVEEPFFRIMEGSLETFAKGLADAASNRGIPVKKIAKPMPFFLRE